MTSPITPHADPVAEGRRLARAAREAELRLRLAGGVGVALRCPSASAPPLQRTYKDIDVAGRSADRKRITSLLIDAGYIPDERFNTLHGARRLLFYDDTNGRQLDAFLDIVELCHVIDLRPRLDIAGATLPLADLLLMKLQVVETNDKDFRDMAALLVDQEYSQGNEEAINLEYLAGLAAKDWGLWRTITMVAQKLDAYTTELGDEGIAAAVAAKVATLTETLESAPKSRAWRLRSRLGDRVRWYELPDGTG
jgi:hypothetical protein